MKIQKGIALVLIVLFFNIAYTQAKSEKTEIANWTLLFYLNGDNDIDLENIVLLDEMELIGPPAGVNVILLIDRADSQKDKYYWSDARIYKLVQDNKAAVINSEILKYMGEVNMGDPDTVIDFLTFSMNEFPARHYGLMIGAHGNGWGLGPDLSAYVEDITQKDKSGNRYTVKQFDALALGELKESLIKAKIKPDIIRFNACTMGSLEALYSREAYTDIIIASPTPLSKSTYDRYTNGYKFLFRDLESDSDISPLVMARKMVNASIRGGEFYRHNHRLLALEFSEINKIKMSLTEFNRELLAFLESDTKAVSQFNSIKIPESYNYYYNKENIYTLGKRVDLNVWAQGIIENIDDHKLRKTARELLDSLEHAFIKDENKKSGRSFFITYPRIPQLELLHVYEGSIKSISLEEYLSLDFIKETGWDKIIKLQMEYSRK